MTKKLLIACACLCSLWMGCGDDEKTGSGSAKDGGADTGKVGEKVEKEITAKKGGTIETKGAALSIPAGALKKDTTITVETISSKGLADEKNIASAVFDFGPDGTKFEKPVELTVDFDASGAPENSVATLSWLDGDKWTALEDSKVDGKTVVATTTHFTRFAVVFTVGAGQVAGQCMEDFKPCGGDIAGKWKFSASCATAPDNFLGLKGDGGVFADCDTLTVEIGVDLSGTIDFADDKTFSTDGNQDVDFTITIPKSCLPMGVTDCEFLKNNDDAGGNKVTETDEACVAVGAQSMMNMKTGTYSVKDNMLTTMNDGADAGPADSDEYCVDGDTLVVKTTGDGTTVFYKATRTN